MLAKLSNMTHIHIEFHCFTNEIITLLLRYAETLKSLCLVECYWNQGSKDTLADDVKLNSQKLLELSKFIHLEKIQLVGNKNFPCVDEGVFSIMKNCPNINHVTLGMSLV